MDKIDRIIEIRQRIKILQQEEKDILKSFGVASKNPVGRPRKAKGKWSAYKRKKFSERMKLKYANMPTEEKKRLITARLNGRKRS